MKKEKEVVKAVYHKDVTKFFESIGLTEELSQGKLFCSICGAIITTDNFRAVLRKSGELLFCCDQESCILKFTLLTKEDTT